MEATKQISLDMLAVGIPPAVEAKQNDTARVIAASLYAGGNVFDVPVGAIAVFRYRKPDGTAGFYDALPDDTPAISIERNVVTILLVEQVLTVPGDVQCEINLYNTAGEKLTTFTFCLRVQASVLTDAEIISSDYFNVLSEKVAQALQAAADAAASAQEAKDAAASINPGTYMQKTMYDPENKQKPYIPADEALSLASYGGSAVGVVSKADVAAACTGNAATAIKLATARKIGSASFDGTADVTLAQMGAMATSSGIHNTTETDTGEVWIDGKKIYRKTFEVQSALPASGYVELVPVDSFPNIYDFVGVTGFRISPSESGGSNGIVMVPFMLSGSFFHFQAIRQASRGVELFRTTIETGTIPETVYTWYLNVRYTKTAD